MLHNKSISPYGLANDSWYGYLDAWIYDVGVTRMEKTAPSPCWTGLTLVGVGARGQERKGRRRHLMHDAMHSAQARVAFKGAGVLCPNGLGKYTGAAGGH